MGERRISMKFKNSLLAHLPDYASSGAIWILQMALMLAIWSLALCAIGQESEYKSVVAEGVSALMPGKPLDRAYDEALLDAKRTAVEMGVGTLVDSKSIVENYQLISDRILTHSSGYLRTFKVVSKGKDGDLYRVVITAEVGLGKIKDDLIAIAVLKEEKGYPRLMLIGMEKVGEKPKTTFSAQTVIEDVLGDKGFDLVDKSQVDVIKARDVAMNPDDYGKAAALGRRFGAEIVIVFQAIADYEGTSDVYGALMHSYRGTVDARIIYTDTGDLLGAVDTSDHAAAEGKPAAVRLAFQKTARKIAPMIMDKILSDWQKHINKLELVVSGLSYRQMDGLKKILKEMRRVKGVATPEFTKGVAIYRIQADMRADDLADHLLENAWIPGLIITTVSANRVEAKVPRVK